MMFVAVSSLKRTITIAGLLLVLLTAYLNQVIVATALPRIIVDLAGSAMLPWMVTTIAAPVYGKLGDLLGRKYVLLVGITLFAFGSTHCGASGSIQALAHLDGRKTP